MKKKLFFLTCLLIVVAYSQAQLTVSPELKRALGNKTRFNDIMQTVTNYYNSKGYANDPKLLS
ncbi:hypothetical protein, partial [Rhizobium leguminosarum]|uniref:hypothetical protein n=1 Tax=Rhizobium leguminosarum TaxID=384 RepID=UPI003F984C93